MPIAADLSSGNEDALKHARQFFNSLKAEEFNAMIEAALKVSSSAINLSEHFSESLIRVLEDEIQNDGFNLLHRLFSAPYLHLDRLILLSPQRMIRTSAKCIRTIARNSSGKQSVESTLFDYAGQFKLNTDFSDNVCVHNVNENGFTRKRETEANSGRKTNAGQGIVFEIAPLAPFVKESIL